MVCEVEGSYVQVGVVSWGYGCAEAGRPGVYANVMEVNAWLEESQSKNYVILKNKVLKFFLFVFLTKLVN